MTVKLFESPAAPIGKSSRGEPTWEIARFFPLQGEWTDEEFLAFSADRFVELNDGFLEIPAMPNFLHQTVVGVLFQMLQRFVTERKLGHASFAPFPIRLWGGQYREPDVVFLGQDRFRKIQESGFRNQPDGADLVMEVMSPGDDNRRRDLVDKREIYARGGIPEYWIIDIDQRVVTVLALQGAAYRTHGEFSPGTPATSVLLDGFVVDVRELFAAVDAVQ